MATYIIRRLLEAIPVLLFIAVALFAVLHLVPGDPVLAMFGGKAFVSQDMVEAKRHELGLDRPLYVQFFAWLGGILRGDLGYSYINHIPVATLLMRRLPASLELAVASLCLAILVALPGGVLSAVKQGSVIDHAVTAVVTAGIALPDFWLGIMIVFLFAVALGWLPSSGYVELWRDPIGNLRFLVLPALTMQIKLAAPTMRFLRSAMLDVLGQEYIQVARAKGLAEKTVIYRHALKNALIPAVTVVGLQFGAVIGGAVMVEWIFGWPGVGWQIVYSIQQRDYWVVLGGVLVVAVIFILANLVVDILYAALDPRIRRA